MLLLLNRVSYDDVQQAARIFGELWTEKGMSSTTQIYCSCGRHETRAEIFLRVNVRPHTAERVGNWCLLAGVAG